MECDCEPCRELVQRLHRGCGSILRQNERHLGKRDTRGHVQHALALDQSGDVGETHPERPLQLTGGLGKRRVLRELLRQLRAAVKGEDGQCVGRHLREQRGREVLPGGLTRLHRALELRRVGLRR